MKTLTFRLIEKDTEIFMVSGKTDSIESRDSRFYSDCSRGEEEDQKFISLRNGHYSIQRIYDSLLSLAINKGLNNYKISIEVK